MQILPWTKKVYKMNFQTSMTDVMSKLAEKGIDFTVKHGKDTKGKIRSYLIAETSPAVRVDFGDRKHGNWISRIHDADDHTKMFGNEWVDNLFDNDFEVTRPWTSGSNKNSDA